MILHHNKLMTNAIYGPLNLEMELSPLLATLYFNVDIYFLHLNVTVNRLYLFL